MRKPATIFITFLSAVLIFNCSGGDNFTTEMVDGVTVVHNSTPKWGDNPKVELVFVKSIGGDDAEDENFQFFQMRDAIKDDEGNMYVLDSGNHRVQKFDNDGAYIKTIGQQGQGPGELMNPTSLGIDMEENLHVTNMANFRVEKFSLNGEFQKTYKMTKMFYTFRTLSMNELVAPVISMPFRGASEANDKKNLVAILSNEGEIISSFGDLKEYENPMMTGMANMVFVEGGNNRDIYVVYGAENKIEKYSSEGELLWRADRPLPYEVKHEMIKRTFDFGGQSREMDFPRITNVSSAVAVDAIGRIWIQTAKVRPEIPDDPQNTPPTEFAKVSQLEIYDGEGIWLGKIPLPGDLAMIRIQDNTVLFHNNTYTSLHEYRIAEK